MSNFIFGGIVFVLLSLCAIFIIMIVRIIKAIKKLSKISPHQLDGYEKCKTNNEINAFCNGARGLYSYLKKML